MGDWDWDCLPVWLVVSGVRESAIRVAMPAQNRCDTTDDPLTLLYVAHAGHVLSPRCGSTSINMHKFFAFEHSENGRKILVHLRIRG